VRNSTSQVNPPSFCLNLGVCCLNELSHFSLAGSVRAYLEWIEINKENNGLLAGASTQPMRLITGSCFVLSDQVLILLAQTRQGYATLTALITTARQRTGKGDYRLELNDLVTEFTPN
jgi:DNA polymerase III alpha subunit